MNLPAYKPLTHSASSPRLLVPFEFVEEIARKRGAWPAVFRHPLPTRCFETKDTVLPGNIAGDRNASFPGVRRRCSASGNSNTSSTILSHVLNSLCSSICVTIKRGLRGSAVALHGIGCGAVAAVHATMLAQELIIRGIRLVARAAR